jgi:hypothetical protein
VASGQVTVPNILARAQPASVRPRHLKLLTYGDPGVGKTRLFGTFEEADPPIKSLLLDVEGGALTLMHTNVEVVRIKTWTELVAAYKELYASCFSENWTGTRYEAVGLDSLTELQKLNMGDLMSAVTKLDSDRDRYVPSMREWGKSLEMIREIVRRFRDLPMHVYWSRDHHSVPSGEVGSGDRRLHGYRRIPFRQH